MGPGAEPISSPRIDPLIGSPIARKEDLPLLAGTARYVDDIALPRMAYMMFVRSSEAHARIQSINVSEARGLPEVLGIWRADELPELPSLPCNWEPRRPPLATDKVRFVGEPLAVVAARDEHAAADACALVTVEYESIPSVSDVECALAEHAPLVFDASGTNELMYVPVAGTAEEALAAAPHRASLRFANQRCAAVPIEVGACVAEWGPKGLTLWATTQVPHSLRNYIAGLFGLTQNQVRVIAPDVGGGFGSKNVVYPEYLVGPVLSRRLGRPVKSIQTRSESLVHMAHGRDSVHDVEVGFDEGGHILALRLQLTQNLGAWPDPIGVSLVGNVMSMSTGCYKVPKVAIGIRTVFTNTTPVSAYRGAGRPEAAYAIERIMDVIADVTGIDPVDVRRRNFIDRDDFPYTTSVGFAYDSGDYHQALDRLLQLVDYEDLKRQQQSRRDAFGSRLLGIGFSTFVGVSGAGPSSRVGALYLGGWESARVRVNPDATVVVSTGTSPHGQGTDTIFAQIAADILGVEFDSIAVLHGDTASVQEGIGTWGSRGVAVGGEAVARASREVRIKAQRVAAHLLLSEPGDLELVHGVFATTGDPARSISWSEVARAAYVPTKLPAGLAPGLEETLFHEPDGYTCSFGAHCCVVEVDAETGTTCVLRYVAVDDAGTIINPMLADGQVHGGVAQGIGQALLEHIAYDERGHPLAVTLADYLIPTAADLPSFETAFTTTPTTLNSLGSKGVGESGTTGAPAAVINAIVDALSHLGVRHIDMPATPERVWTAIREASSVSGEGA
jgi:carbon-monoxide dehydrogenase large subunit